MIKYDIVLIYGYDRNNKRCFCISIKRHSNVINL